MAKSRWKDGGSKITRIFLFQVLPLSLPTHTRETNLPNEEMETITTTRVIQKCLHFHISKIAQELFNWIWVGSLPFFCLHRITYLWLLESWDFNFGSVFAGISKFRIFQIFDHVIRNLLTTMNLNILVSIIISTLFRKSIELNNRNPVKFQERNILIASSFNHVPIRNVMAHPSSRCRKFGGWYTRCFWWYSSA